MTLAIDQTEEGRDLLSSVALLRDLPECGLVRGQVGTIVEPLDEATALVEFSNDEGRAYAIVPCPREALLILRTAPSPRDRQPANRAPGNAPSEATREKCNCQIGKSAPVLPPESETHPN